MDKSKVQKLAKDFSMIDRVRFDAFEKGIEAVEGDFKARMNKIKKDQKEFRVGFVLIVLAFLIIFIILQPLLALSVLVIKIGFFVSIVLFFAGTYLSIPRESLNDD